LSRWHRDEADLGWRSPQCLSAGGQRRQFGGFSGDSGHLRGRQGGQVRVVAIPAPPRRPRPQRRAADHLRRLPRLDGECRGVSARRSVAALHGSFLSERLQPCAGHQVREVSHMLKAIHAQESRDAADRKARTIVEDLRAAKMHTAADLVERSVSETLTYYAFPDIHWQKIRTTDEIDKPFLLDLLFWRSTGDRVAKSRARGCQPGRAAVTVAPHWRHPCAVFQDDAAAIG